ncbi:MAG: SAM-dependent methyltransferase [Puniceicoccaceae bacterium]
MLADLLTDKIVSSPHRIISLADFVSIALYHDPLGYYHRPRQRVGTESGTDFYTNLAYRSVLAPLVIEGISRDLPHPPSSYTFYEIASEPEGGLLRENDPHPFAGIKFLRLGDPLTFAPRSLIFANEWLDAQPFHRFRFLEANWAEMGVTLSPENDFAFAPFPYRTAELEELLPFLPARTSHGYTLDLSLRAESCLQQLLEENWQGRFLTFDYGQTWDTFIHHLPQGSGRAYHRHQQSPDLLAQPGDQDLTCSLCWDRLVAVAERFAISPPVIQRQEAWLMHHASRAISKLIQESASGYSEKRNRLLSLLHPAQMGSAFQVFEFTR